MTDLVLHQEALVANAPDYQLTNPKDIIKFSKVLSEFITKSELSTTIQGKKYVNVDGWKFAGLNFGLVPITSEPVPSHNKGDVITILYHEIQIRDRNGVKRIESPFFASTNQELVEKFRKDSITRELTTDYYNYSCQCEIINTQTGVRVGSGAGLCSNLELKKVTFDEYAVHAFAQTRSIGRAFKNVIGFIIKSAGYEPTPIEEMEAKNKIIVVDGESATDITQTLKGAKNLDDLQMLWESLPASAQSNAAVKGAFSRKKNQVKSKK